MNAGERRIKIFEILNDKKFVEVNQLAEEFNVTPMTIRRDLAKLVKQGIATLNYGGAVLNEGASVEPTFKLKSGKQADLKEEIAYEASLLINDGESIAIDCGTTTLMIAKYLGNKRITVLTNSWKVIQILHEFPKIQIILAPGIYDRVSEGAISASTINFYHNYNVDKAFISTQGFDIEKGASVPEEIDGKVKRSIFDSAQYKILLCDHTKIGYSYLSKFADLNEFDAIIMDKETDKDFIKKAKDKNLNVSVALSYQNNLISKK